MVDALDFVADEILGLVTEGYHQFAHFLYRVCMELGIRFTLIDLIRSIPVRCIHGYPQYLAGTPGISLAHLVNFQA